MTGSSGHTPVDVAVVGAGPAGLAAAVAAAGAGLQVAVVDANPQPGGQYWRHRDESTDEPTLGQHDIEKYAELRRRFDRARAGGCVEYLPNSQVWFIERQSADGGGPAGFVLRLTGFSDVGPRPVRAQVVARRLILCPGGYDRQLPIPGWDLPGVMAAGGVQAMLKGYGVRSGSRAIVAGTGPFLLPVATSLAEGGVDVVGICEAGAVTSWLRQSGGAMQVPAKGLEAAEYALTLARRRIGYWMRTAIVAINGTDEVRSVTVAKLDRQGRARPGTRREIEVDLVALGWGFTPSLELVAAVGAETRVDVDGSLVAVVDEAQQSTAPGVYAAGEVTGVGGAALAVLEGELAGRAVARAAVGVEDPSRWRVLQGRIRRARAFAGAMHRAHPVPAQWHEWLTGSTVVCRCEEVSYAEVCYARDELGAADARTVKALSRPGMGWCQGRVCGFATAQLAAIGQAEAGGVSAEGLRPIAKRPLCAPIALGDLAALSEVGQAEVGQTER
ncbi:MAG: FAD-dependent oxidoreductase [Microlunatus sp.]